MCVDIVITASKIEAQILHRSILKIDAGEESKTRYAFIFVNDFDVIELSEKN